MAQKPFLFDSQTFDDDAPKAVAEIVEKPVYTQSYLDQAVEAARIDGEENGNSKAMNSIESELRIMVSALPGAINTLIQNDQAQSALQQAEAVKVALFVLRKILPSLAENNALSNIEQFIAKTLSERFEEKRLVIRVSPHVIELLKTHIDDIAVASNFSGQTILLPEPSLPIADCRLEWADGGAERDTARLYQDIELSIEQFLPTLTENING